MKHLKPLLILLVLPLLSVSSAHKYYVSISEIEYAKEQQAVQIISRIFIDDFENVLRRRYDENLILASVNEPKTANVYIEKYLAEKFSIKINGKQAQLSFIGKEYDVDVMHCYLEITGVERIDSIEISNTVLFDLFAEQQNVIRAKINSKNKSFVLTKQKDSRMLKF